MRDLAVEGREPGEVVARLCAGGGRQGRVQCRDVVECHLRDQQVAARIDRERIGEIRLAVQHQRADAGKALQNGRMTGAIVIEKSVRLRRRALIANDI